ncbi:hypothetical protein NMY22_g3193 [Coprinellus aureogranulatus]|nr:hypothetical protein NMY22_g3193 [Coprinellus aureogranulatus]
MVYDSASSTSTPGGIESKAGSNYPVASSSSLLQVFKEIFCPIVEEMNWRFMTSPRKLGITPETLQAGPYAPVLPGFGPSDQWSQWVSKRQKADRLNSPWLSRPLPPKVADISGRQTLSQQPVALDSRLGAYPKPPSDTSSRSSDPVGIRIVSPTPPASVSSSSRSIPSRSHGNDSQCLSPRSSRTHRRSLTSNSNRRSRSRSGKSSFSSSASTSVRAPTAHYPVGFSPYTQTATSLATPSTRRGSVSLSPTSGYNTAAVSPLDRPPRQFSSQTPTGPSHVPYNQPRPMPVHPGYSVVPSHAVTTIHYPSTGYAPSIASFSTARTVTPIPQHVRPTIVCPRSEAHIQDYVVEPTPDGGFRVINGPTSILPPDRLRAVQQDYGLDLQQEVQVTSDTTRPITTITVQPGETLIFSEKEFPNHYMSVATYTVYGPLQWTIRDRYGAEWLGEAKASPVINGSVHCEVRWDRGLQSTLRANLLIQWRQVSTKQMCPEILYIDVLVSSHRRAHRRTALSSGRMSVWDERKVWNLQYTADVLLQVAAQLTFLLALSVVRSLTLICVHTSARGYQEYASVTATRCAASGCIHDFSPRVDPYLRVGLTGLIYFPPLMKGDLWSYEYEFSVKRKKKSQPSQAATSTPLNNLPLPSSVELQPPTGGPIANPLFSNPPPANPVPANNVPVISFPVNSLEVNPIPTPPLNSVPLEPVGLSAPPQPLPSGSIPSPPAPPPAPPVNISLETAPQAITSPQLSAPQDIGSRSPPRELGRTSDTTHAAHHIVVLVAPPPWFYPHWIIHPHASPYVQPNYPPAYYNPFSGNFMFNGVEGGRSMSILPRDGWHGFGHEGVFWR